MLKLEATKLRSTAADGYMLQLAEIEAYGKPICDKTALQAIMDEYVAAGGDTGAEAYVKAQAGMDNALLTSTSMDVLVRALKAAMPQVEQTTEAETTEPTDDQTTAPEGEGTTEQPEQKGCKSVAGVLIPVIAMAAVVVIKKKKDE